MNNVGRSFIITVLRSGLIDNFLITANTCNETNQLSSIFIMTTGSSQEQISGSEISKKPYYINVDTIHQNSQIFWTPITKIKHRKKCLLKTKKDVQRPCIKALYLKDLSLSAKLQTWHYY